MSTKSKTSTSRGSKVSTKSKPKTVPVGPVRSVDVEITAHNYDHIPQYATDGAACVDLVCPVDWTINPHEIVKIPLGFHVAVPEGYMLDIRSRSGLALRGIVVANSPGTVDSDYRGEVCVLIHNTTKSTQAIRRGTRIAQAVVIAAPRINFVIKQDLSETSRGSGGFGSTG